MIGVGDVPPEIDLASWATSMRGVPVNLIVGDSDEYITPKIVAAERARLDASLVPHRFSPYTGGHEIDAAALMSLAHG